MSVLITPEYATSHRTVNLAMTKPRIVVSTTVLLATTLEQIGDNLIAIAMLEHLLKDPIERFFYTK